MRLALLLAVLTVSAAHADCPRTCDAILRDEVGCCPKVSSSRPGAAGKTRSAEWVIIGQSITNSSPLAGRMVDLFNVASATSKHFAKVCPKLEMSVDYGFWILSSIGEELAGDAANKSKPRYNAEERKYLLENVTQLIGVLSTTPCKLDGADWFEATADLLVTLTKTLTDEPDTSDPKDNAPRPLSVNAKKQLAAADFYLSKFKVSPSQHSIRFFRGRLLYQHRQFDAALAIFLDLIKQSPGADVSELAANLALDIHQRRGKLDDQLKLAEKLMANRNLMTDRDELSKRLEKILREGRKSKD